MISISSVQPTAASSLLSEESAAISTDEPPDRMSHSLPKPISVHTHQFSNNGKSPSLSDPIVSPSVGYSSCVADSTGGSASDYEHEMDSPSSLSSWNSWAGGRRGDLADVEDLELDGMLGGEPELETVSERDEESSGFYSGSDRAGLDSDEDYRQHKFGTLGLGLDTSMPRRKNARPGGYFNDISHTHHVHHALNQHHYHHPSAHSSHAPPSFPHFSPKAGGHGLSHASRHTLRVPPNLAARRRKGRIAELAEEGAGEAINTTIMPSKSASSRRDKELAEEDREGTEQEDAAPSQTETETEEQRGDNFSPSTPTLHSSNSSSSWNDFEFVGPPPLPVRCVSPSETVPVVPSPLCVCLNAEEQANNEDKATTGIQETVPIASPAVEDRLPSLDHASRPASPPVSASVPTTTSTSTPTGKTRSTSATKVSTPSSAPLVRKLSRGRRSSSPNRSKSKVPLRPCFRRRASAQVGNSRQIESSSEYESTSESSSFRGRAKVHFSEEPPSEVRTHSPVDYDRKACPVSNRLSPSDVEELREMKMEMGLLEAKWAAMAACKTESEAEEEAEIDTAPSLLSPPSTNGERKRADSISSSSPTRFCKDRIFSRDTSISPADHLRIEREKERERACRLAGIGTGIGFRYSGTGGASPRQLHHGGSKTPGACNPMSIISRFGLSKPPPPLPGLAPSGYQGGTSLHRPRSAPPVQSSPITANDVYYRQQTQADEKEMARGRSMDKASPRSVNSSTSTDGTETESSPSTPASIPELKHTSPSPDSSPDRNRTIQADIKRSPTLRPSILPHQPPPPSSTNSSFSASMCGYDSPASEFYESGSEYDLVG